MSVTSHVLGQNAFTFSFHVKFDHFRNNYPTCVATETDALECHGLGPVYGSDQGYLSVYLYTTSCRGPHGRGITGYKNQGWVKSCQRLNVGQWYHVEVKKTARSLSLTVDNLESICYIPETMDSVDFVMKPPGRCIINGFRSPEQTLCGQMRDFVVIDENENENEVAPVQAASVYEIQSSREPSTEQSQALSEDQTCSICMEALIDATLVHGQTGHLCVCMNCATSLKNNNALCPICRRPIDFIVKTFK